MDNIDHICFDGHFLQFSEVPIDSMPPLQVNRFSSINLESWIRLVCCVYLDKHKTLYNSEQRATLHASLMNNALPDDKVQLLKWRAYKHISTIHFHGELA